MGLKTYLGFKVLRPFKELDLGFKVQDFFAWRFMGLKKGRIMVHHPLNMPTWLLFYMLLEACFRT